MKKIGILGTGRQAAETAGYLIEDGYEIEFFFVESKYLDEQNPLSEISRIITEEYDLEKYCDIPVITAVGSAFVRKKLVELWPHGNYCSFVHSSSWVSSDSDIGIDVTIPPGVVINTNTTIGDHVLLNIGVTLSHDVVLGDYCTISPGVNIAGMTEVGQASFFGIGSTCIDHLKIGEGAVIAAGALVKENVKSFSMVAGIPAIQKKELKGWQ